jgi:hypothetical protein
MYHNQWNAGFTSSQWQQATCKQITSGTVVNSAVGIASHDSKADPVLTEKQLVATKQPKGHPETKVPLGSIHGFAKFVFVLQQNAPPICPLFGAGCPTNISGFVISVHVDTVERATFRALADTGEKLAVIFE